MQMDLITSDKLPDFFPTFHDSIKCIKYGMMWILMEPYQPWQLIIEFFLNNNYSFLFQYIFKHVSKY